ncbi:MAG: redoxin family protein [Kiloniellaceae bacterium]|nr:redoxin family protein [Kiloniellaceae bacterium]
MAAGPSPASQESTAVMSLHDAPRTLPEIRFADGSGRALTLGAFQGKVILLNIWATWCGPCREEMPTLDRLQSRLGGPDFEVVALSIDRAGIGVVTDFFDEIGINHLAKYIDESGKAAGQLKAVGLPTTLLIDREGREIGRHVGPAEWDTPEMMTFFEQQISRSSDASWTGRASTWAGHPANRSLAPPSLPAALVDHDPAVTDATRSSALTGGKYS